MSSSSSREMTNTGSHHYPDTLVTTLEHKLTTVLVERDTSIQQCQAIQTQYEQSQSQIHSLEQALQHSHDQIMILERALVEEKQKNQTNHQQQQQQQQKLQQELVITQNEREDLQHQVTCLLDAVGTTKSEIS